MVFVKDTHGFLRDELHPDNVVDFDLLTTGSHKKPLWLCSAGHVWEAQISSRVKGSGCPDCARVSNSDVNVTKFFKDEYPDLFKDIRDKETFSSLGVYSRKKIEWLCDNGHSLKETTRERISHHGCRVCNNVVTPVYSRGSKPILASLVKQWDTEKNLPLTINDVSGGSAKFVWWKCEKGHSWKGRINARTSDFCQGCEDEKRLKHDNTFASLPQLLSEWSEDNVFTPEEISLGSKKRIFWVCNNDKEHTWSTYAYQRSRVKTQCPVCSSESFSSKGENELKECVLSLFNKDDLVFNSKKVLDNLFELDVYIPSKNIGLEFNGLYWHSDVHKSPSYHFDKYQACKSKGIQLIQIWEDDWVFNKDVVKKMLKHKLGADFDSMRVGARKTQSTLISYDEARVFLENNHIQGGVQGSRYFGLRYNGSLVAVMVVKLKADKTGEIVRYATSALVPGGFNKLLKFAENECSDKVKIWVTFSDNAVSDGGLYESSGFEIDKRLKSDYSYVVKNKRVHKFNYRLKNFRNSDSLIFKEGLTERELADLNKILRVWDAGKIRWKKVLNKG